jgi:hypothetical protein
LLGDCPAQEPRSAKDEQAHTAMMAPTGTQRAPEPARIAATQSVAAAAALMTAFSQ